MRLLLLTLGFGALSSVVPIFNMEAFLVAVFAKTDGSALQLAVVGSLGQNIGKLAWYYACRGSLEVGWVQRRLQQPRRQRQLERWSEFVQGRPVVSGLLTFASALVGFPPFFAIAMVAGTLRMNAAVFFVAGFLGRIGFFLVLLGGVELVRGLF